MARWMKVTLQTESEFRIGCAVLTLPGRALVLSPPGRETIVKFFFRVKKQRMRRDARAPVRGVPPLI